MSRLNKMTCAIEDIRVKLGQLEHDLEFGDHRRITMGKLRKEINKFYMTYYNLYVSPNNASDVDESDSDNEDNQHEDGTDYDQQSNGSNSTQSSNTETTSDESKNSEKDKLLECDSD